MDLLKFYDKEELRSLLSSVWDTCWYSIEGDEARCNVMLDWTRIDAASFTCVGIYLEYLLS